MSRSILRALKNLPQDHKRVDIVNPDLCGDIIERLAPSLAAYAGCTIIDINPGIGLLSTRLNDLLKPRSHILLEPNVQRYETALKPLLDRPTSRLHIPDLTDDRYWFPSKHEEIGLVPYSGGSGDAGKDESTSKSPILLLANLAGRPNQRKLKLQCAPSNRAVEYARGIREALRHDTEPMPRMLLWMDDGEKSTILPRSVALRTRVACVLESCCHVEEVAGTLPPLKARREDAIVLESQRRVAAAMQQHGIVTPPHRIPDEEHAVSEATKTSRDWHKEMQELEEVFGIPPGPIKSLRGMWKRSGGKRSEHGSSKDAKWLRLQYLRRNFNSNNSIAARLEEVLQLQEEIDRLDLLAYTDTTDVGEREARFQELDVKIEELKERLGSLKESERREYRQLDDERRSFRMNPPLLLWDRRSVEPLVAQRDDFWQPVDGALLDFRPRSDWKSLPVTTVEQDIAFERVSSTLTRSRNETGLKHLDTMANGAYKALVQDVPYYRDPRYGGRRDVASVRSRTIPSAMFEKLALDWDQWEFKPPITDLFFTLDHADRSSVKRARAGFTKFL